MKIDPLGTDVRTYWTCDWCYCEETTYGPDRPDDWAVFNPDKRAACPRCTRLIFRVLGHVIEGKPAAAHANGLDCKEPDCDRCGAKLPGPPP